MGKRELDSQDEEMSSEEYEGLLEDMDQPVKEKIYIDKADLLKEETYNKELAKARLTSSFEHQLIAQKANQILAIDVAKYKKNLAKEIELQKKTYIQELEE